MFVILVYDVNVSRVGKVLKISRRYLTWVQNSVLEGELTEATLRALQNETCSVINQGGFCMLFYILGNESSEKIMGIRKGGEGWILGRVLSDWDTYLLHRVTAGHKKIGKVGFLITPRLEFHLLILDTNISKLRVERPYFLY